MPKILIVLLLNLSIAASPVWAQENTEAIDAMEEYLDFVDYGGATIFPEQIPAQDWKNFFVVDARDAAQFEKEHIPGGEYRMAPGSRTPIRASERQANPDLLQHWDVVSTGGICSSHRRI